MLIQRYLGFDKRLVYLILTEVGKAAETTGSDSKAIVCGFIYDLFQAIQQRGMAKSLGNLFQSEGLKKGALVSLVQKTSRRLSGKDDPVVYAAALAVDLLNRSDLQPLAKRTLALLEILVSDQLAEREFSSKVAFNKYNAPELLRQLVTVLESEGLDYVVAALKQKDVLRLVDRAWRLRGKMADQQKLAMRLEREWLKTAAGMPEGEFWKMVAKIGWGTKTTNYEAIKAAILNKYHTKQEIEGIHDTFGKLKDRLYRRLDEWMELNAPDLDNRGWGTGDDGFDDLCSHIIGLGKKEYDAVMKDPKLAWDRARKGQYKESFSYAIPWDRDMDLQDPKYFKGWAKRSLGDYSVITKDPDLKAFHGDAKKLMKLLQLVVDGKVDAFYAKRRDAEKLATKLYDGWKKVSRRLPRESAEMPQKWSVTNMIRDLTNVYYRKTNIKLGRGLEARWFHMAANKYENRKHPQDVGIEIKAEGKRTTYLWKGKPAFAFHKDVKFPDGVIRKVRFIKDRRGGKTLWVSHDLPEKS